MQKVTSSIGETRMIHLFTDGSLFYALENECYMQIAGKPLVGLA